MPILPIASKRARAVIVVISAMSDNNNHVFGCSVNVLWLKCPSFAQYWWYINVNALWKSNEGTAENPPINAQLWNSPSLINCLMLIRLMGFTYTINQGVGGD